MSLFRTNKLPHRLFNIPYFIITTTYYCLLATTITTTTTAKSTTFIVSNIPRCGNQNSPELPPLPPYKDDDEMGEVDYRHEHTNEYMGYDERRQRRHNRPPPRDRSSERPDEVLLERRDYPYEHPDDEDRRRGRQMTPPPPPPYPYNEEYQDYHPTESSPEQQQQFPPEDQHTYDTRIENAYAQPHQNPIQRNPYTTTTTPSRRQTHPYTPPELPGAPTDEIDDLPLLSETTTTTTPSIITPTSSSSEFLAAASTSASVGTTSTPTSAAASSLDLSQFDKDMIFSGLKRLYRKKILPLELSSKYGHFHSPPLSPSDFDAKPMVLLVGQYSVGKTSFIRYLLGRDFPGIRIGPEPTTDRFAAIMIGSGDKCIPGAALCSQANQPFRGLSPFGNNFLSRFEGVEMDSPILHNITLVDTPGILSGEKQQIGRNYDYEQVMKWFAERADLIIIMFDAHKLDISDELKRVIQILIPHQDKIRVVLNKADAISTQQLMRVYGALMWSLGKVMMTPEVCRVYMGSFWDAPLQNTDQSALFLQEKMDLFHDIMTLPQNAVMRRINELVKRARAVKVHAYIIHYLRKQLPYTWGKKEKQRKLIGRLEREFVMCARRYELPKGDFPPLEPFRQALLEIKDLSEFAKLDKKMVKEMDRVFGVDIPELLERARHF